MDIKALVNTAKEMEDQSVATAGGDFEYTPPAAGKTIGRFIEYIELGKHIELYEGKPKPAAEMVRVTFELLGVNDARQDIKEVEIDGNKKTIADRLSITMPKKMNEKAKFYKLFKAMTYGRTEITHMAEMLGEAFVLTVTHNTSGEGANKRVYANLYSNSVWGVAAPRVEDAIAGTSADISARVPAVVSALKIFLWNNPTKETWDSLFIDGERDVKDDKGNVTKESKNWLQEKILSATDFGGSALQQMVAGLDKLPTTGTTVQTSQTLPKEQENVSTGATDDAPAGTQTAATVTADDALKALGL